MNLQRIRAISRADLTIRRSDVVPIVILVLMPLVLMAFLRNAFRPALIAAGFRNASGAEQAVPGMAVMFGFFLVPNIGYSFYREYGWETWDRLRTSGATASEIMLGKTSVPFLMAIVQAGLLFGAGAVLFGLTIRGSILELLLVAFCFGACLVGLALLYVAFTRSVIELNAVANLGALLMAGFGGALTPIGSLPQWAQNLARITPGYWAMRGYSQVVLASNGSRDIFTPAVVLLAFGLAFSVIAKAFFRVDRRRTAWI